MTSLFTALDHQKYDAARLLIEEGANVNINPRDLMLATAIGTLEIRKMLIKGGANMQSVQQALTAAAHAGEIDKVILLLRHRLSRTLTISDASLHCSRMEQTSTA
jgi:ankyrin repeat protein